MNLPCGHTARQLSLERPSGELDEARFGRHVLACPECVAFLHALDGIWTLAKQQARQEDAQQEARQQRAWPGKVRRLRQCLGLSQQELADKLGVARVTVGRWEKGRQTAQGLARKVVEEEIARFNKGLLAR